MSRFTHALVVLALALATSAAQSRREPPSIVTATTFAVVVDAATWAAIPDAIHTYRAAVEQDGLGTWILVDDWRGPETVRDALRRLHRVEPPLEGALLVGRIPVAMLRGAQHLTSAFKMDEQRYPRTRSSVPTDRFYEDFDLVCEPLGNDEENPLLTYYELAPESAQRIDKEIYTARLLPTLEGDEAHAAIAACLGRFARLRRDPQPLDRVLTMIGHGYVSESLDAWADARRLLTEQLPALHRPGGALIELHHLRGAELEELLLRELADPDLDVALLHSHGDDDRQFLLGDLPLPTTAAKVEALRRDARSRLRQARTRGESEAEAKIALMERYGLPLDWFDDAFDEEVTAADEALDARTELTCAEVEAIVPGADVIHLDACFNGNFVVRPYQAAAYLFGSSETAVVVANSVNVAQDVAADRRLDLLGSGRRIGAWHRLRPHLESHLFGDPTFRFARPTDDLAPRLTELLDRIGELDDTRLLQHLHTHRSAVVRLEALAELARRRGTAFEEALPLAARDPAEFVRRCAVSLMGDVGRPDHVAVVLSRGLRDPSERVVFDAREAVKKFDPDAVRTALDAVLANVPRAPGGAERDALLRSFTAGSFVAEDLAKAADRSLGTDQRVRAIRTYRLYRAHPAVPGLIALARATDDEPAVRAAALEALGWFVFSIERGRILTACTELAADLAAPEVVRRQATKTAARLRDGANDPLLP
ncbi:MAG: HEAT repeat domain-containing protein [Planctomycetes bacterium]|nr:HEAT repeat domain-containing protein [Planctomycetota bacterium]